MLGGDASGHRTIALVTLVVLAVIGTPVVTGGSVTNFGTERDAGCYAQDYEVTLTDVTIETWRLINVTVENVVANEVVVRNAWTVNGTVKNATLENVTMQELFVREGTLTNVTADRLVVRNRSILDVPGADLVNQDISGLTEERHVLKDVTVDGLVIDRIEISSFTVLNESLESELNESNGVVPSPESMQEPDIEIDNTSMDRSKISRSTGSGWQIESEEVEDESLTNESTPPGWDPGHCSEHAYRTPISMRE